MRRNLFSKTAPNYVGAWVVCALAVLLVSNGSFAQTQRPPTKPEPRDAGWAPPTIPDQRNVGWAPPTSSEPSRPYLSDPSASGGSGDGLAGTTPILHESAKLTASDAGAFFSFGNSAAMSADTAVVGSTHAGCAAGRDCGAAYVFRFNGTEWQEEQKLTATDGETGDAFGFSVAMDGEIALVGAPRSDCTTDDSCGSAYVYRFDGNVWIQEQKLTGPDAVTDALFGWSVALSGNTAMVGAIGVDCAAGPRCGAAYVFQFDGNRWVEKQKLHGFDETAEDRAGWSVFLSGELAVMAVIKDACSAGSSCGSVDVFRFDGTGWLPEQRLSASDAERFDDLGFSVSASGNTIVAGAVGVDCPAGDNCGAAYVFRSNGSHWLEEQKLTPADTGPGDQFGFSVSMNGDTLVVGARLHDCSKGINCGSAHVFHFDGSGWVEERKLAAFESQVSSNLGSSVFLHGSVALVGAPGVNCSVGDVCGAAYVFNLGPVELDVAIDIKPGNDINPVNLGARGVLPVAVLTTSVADGDLADFDAADVDSSSVTLAGAAPRMKGRSGRVGSLVDIDGDGDLDLLLHFPIAELELTLPDDGGCLPDASDAPGGGQCPPYRIEAVLLGQTFDGTSIRGSDTITAIQAQRLDAERIVSPPFSGGIKGG